MAFVRDIPAGRHAELLHWTVSRQSRHEKSEFEMESAGAVQRWLMRLRSHETNSSGTAGGRRPSHRTIGTDVRQRG